ncbi:MAG: helix-turn-helix transcriptional regulator, partial [Eggerthellaceae bacterium]|nr:helix-turn-helix transcriptional regulator [Eggerthellaceae bacterium]
MEKLKGKLIFVPFCFTGMGIFRVWTETVYSNSAIAFPAQAVSGCGFATFNILAAVVLLSLAFAARKIAPLFNKRFAYIGAGVGLSASAFLNFASIYLSSMALPFGVAAVILGAVGIALIILLWSELFSCLNPLRVGLYFSGGLVVGALILWLFKGLLLPWLWVCTCLIPPISLICLHQAYRHLSGKERPHTSWGHFTFPWKPIAIVALFSFSYGLCEPVFSSALGIHSGFGCVFAALIVYCGICIRRIEFRYSLVYQLAGLFMMLSLLPLTNVVPFWAHASGFLALAGYTFALIAIMVVLSNISYQYGVNAVWLFGIERAVRLASVQGGIELKHVLN